jgi:uncharacterized repeat protein (TIGR03803 family)
MSSLCHALRHGAAAKSHVLALALAPMAGALLCVAAADPAPAAESVAYSFNSAPDGNTPDGNLAIATDGTLYGTTVSGGAHGKGAVYKLTPIGAFYSESIIYSFKGGRDGQSPYGAVALDPAGNIYGVTAWGGKGCENLGCGTVFEMSPDGGGWKEKVLYRLRYTREGEDSLAGLTRDSQGNLYGATAYGGACGKAPGAGTVFELSLVDGRWTSNVLSTFCKAGAGPAYGSLVLDKAGYLYGTAGSIVFRLANAGGKGWRQTVLHDFSQDGGYAMLMGGVTLDDAGNVYAANATGGTGCDGAGCGTVFELEAAKGWKPKTLYTFHGADGDEPFDAPTFDAAGNLYGTTMSGGGCGGDCGLVYELSPAAHGAWKETVLHAFGNDAGDGYSPLAGVPLDNSGNLLGVTTKGGGGDYRRCDCGAVYQITTH